MPVMHKYLLMAVRSHAKSVSRSMPGSVLRTIVIFVLFILGSSATVLADVNVDVFYVARDVEPPLPLSLVDKQVENAGFAGAQLGLNDNQTTGSFLGHKYNLIDVLVAEEADVVETLKQSHDKPPSVIVANLSADDLLNVSDSFPSALVFNVRAKDDRVRHEDCRVNVLHMPPSRSMLTDALAQYLSWKRWNKVVIVTGRHPEDALYAAALERASKRFGLKVVERKDWTSVPGARRTDSGHHSAQQEIPTFTRFKEYDVLLVADEIDEFGEYLSYRASTPRLVAGTQGLTPTAWHRSHEQWGATQIQRRFEKIADRNMTEHDYSAWLAMRALGESVSVLNSADPDKIKEHLLSDKFKLAGFKGKALTFRKYNGQLRQPVLVVSPRMLITVSPQQGFLHQLTDLDTLGIDEPESACKLFSDN